MQHQLVTTPVRPSRAQIEPAALALLSRHSARLLATARRYSACPEDAEDAYQRGVEILLTKAPTTSEAELLPWLKTVVKHEAHAMRKAGDRALPVEDGLAAAADGSAWTDERAERYEQLRVGAEAMSGLKPQEIRCLLLKAEGLSYAEICEVTGFTYTKVNRCLTEGRRAFLARVTRIESGAECERLAPLLSKMADGEATPEELRELRPHVKGCLACKATLREYRAAPARLAGLVPPVVALAGGGSGTLGFVGRLLQRFGEAHDTAAAKLAAVAASAVVVAGGGAAGLETLHHDEPPLRRAADVPAQATPSQSTPAAVTPAVDANRPPRYRATAVPVEASAPRVASAPSVPAARAAAPTPEFDPGTASGSQTPAASTQPPAPASDFGAPVEQAPPPTEMASGAPATEFGP